MNASAGTDRGRAGVIMRAAMAAALCALPLVASSGRAANVARFLAWGDAPTPTLDLKDLDGRRHTLADYRGKVVLVNFWATWCEPCRDELPSLHELHEVFAEEPFEILAVNYGEGATRASEFLEDFLVDFPVLLDPGQRTARAWRVRLLPSSFVVGRDGRARYRIIGELDWANAEAVDVVRKLLH